MAELERIDAFWVAPELGVFFDIREEQVERPGGPAVVRWPVLEPAHLEQLTSALRARQADVLARRSMDDLIGVLDRVAELWLDPAYPLRVRAVETISAFTGFSVEMVGHAIDLEQKSSRADDIRAALNRELGD